jgi:hypothetical protein
MGKHDVAVNATATMFPRQDVQTDYSLVASEWYSIDDRRGSVASSGLGCSVVERSKHQTFGGVSNPDDQIINSAYRTLLRSQDQATLLTQILPRVYHTIQLIITNPREGKLSSRKSAPPLQPISQPFLFGLTCCVRTYQNRIMSIKHMYLCVAKYLE